MKKRHLNFQHVVLWLNSFFVDSVVMTWFIGLIEHCILVFITCTYHTWCLQCVIASIVGFYWAVVLWCGSLSCSLCCCCVICCLIIQSIWEWLIWNGYHHRNHVFVYERKILQQDKPSKNVYLGNSIILQTYFFLYIHSCVTACHKQLWKLPHTSSSVRRGLVVKPQQSLSKNKA